jgi:hypothetical protein
VGPLSPGMVATEDFEPAVYGQTGALRASNTRRLRICADSLGSSRSMTVVFLVSGKTVSQDDGGGGPPCA